MKRIFGTLFLAAALLSFDSPSARAQTDAATQTQVQYLSGHGKDDTVQWDFECSGGRNSGSWAKIAVPSCWELQGFGFYNYGNRNRVNQPNYADQHGFYKYQFNVPADWKNRDVKLVFDGVLTDTDVKINGQSAGPVHQGGFYRFDYDVTRLLKFGESNLIEVEVSEVSANASVNRAERQGDYWNFAGIFRPVWLKALPAQHIERTAINAQADGTFAADVFVSSNVAGPAKVVAQIVDAAGKNFGAPFSADVPKGGGKVGVTSKLNGVKTWNAETPNLYTVRFTLSQNGATQHVTTERFGFRTFEVRADDGLYLNGEKIVLKGVNRHSLWPETGRTLSKEVCFNDAKLIKEANMNAVRMSHYPPDVDFLDACDELGVYVLDELAGWHGAYDTAVGTILVDEMVARDVNHPSILFWDNGDEQSTFNTDMDREFEAMDLQRRDVLHPWRLYGNVETKHYPNYAEVAQLSAGKEIFMPTEMLHGLYDGGSGASFDDMWGAMSKAPNNAGGFFWAFLDEGVARSDQGGKIDNSDNYAPDGIVGPHREKEGSFFTIKQIWSPLQIVSPKVTGGKFEAAIENHYDFTNLNQCKLDWKLVKFAPPGITKASDSVLSSGNVSGPNVEPHGAGTVSFALPAATPGDANALLVTAKDQYGEELWTWTVPLKNVAVGPSLPTNATPAQGSEDGTQLVVKAGTNEWRFDKTTGLLAGLSRDGKTISLSNGPNFFALATDRPPGTEPGGRSPNPDPHYASVGVEQTLKSFAWHQDGDTVVVAVTFNGSLTRTEWRISSDGAANLDYDYTFNGTINVMGVNFDYPEANVKAKRWLGNGPYHVWQNRLKGGWLDVWSNDYNNSIPGQVYAYPEFKGFFSNWRWMTFDTTEGALTFQNTGGIPFIGVYQPNDGVVTVLTGLSGFGISLMDVIPAIGSKFNGPEPYGPQSQPQTVSGPKHRSVVIY